MNSMDLNDFVFKVCIIIIIALVVMIFRLLIKAEKLMSDMDDDIRGK